MSDRMKQKMTGVYFTLVGITLIIIFVLALTVGRYKISVVDFFKMLFGSEGYEIERSVVLNLRLPRTIIAALTGTALSVSGLLYQETFQNRLVSPDLLGVSSGAGVGAALASGAVKGAGLNIFINTKILMIFRNCPGRYIIRNIY